MLYLQGTRGSSTNLPFWPGGFELPPLPPASAQHEELDLSPSSLLTCPPGFDHGIDFSQQGGTGEAIEQQQQPSVLNLAAVLSPGDDILALFKEPETSNKTEGEQRTEDGRDGGGEDGLSLPEPSSVLPISEGARPGIRSTEWAEMLDSEGSIPDFHTQVPQMAYQWPFELDTFQKQAVLKLEQAESVFVAAHTSAGG